MILKSILLFLVLLGFWNYLNLVARIISDEVLNPYPKKYLVTMVLGAGAAIALVLL